MDWAKKRKDKVERSMIVRLAIQRTRSPVKSVFEKRQKKKKKKKKEKKMPAKKGSRVEQTKKAKERMQKK